MITRRHLLKSMAVAAGFSLMPFGRKGWVLAAPEAVSRRMIVVLMRGAVDGLSVVTPFMEPNYYQSRRSIALAPPGQTDGLINLDGNFGLHPSLATVMPLWQNKSLAFIHACGSPAETRSHFEAQDIMETALLNTATAQQGWMNALAQAIPDTHASTRALSFGNTLPKIFTGRANVATVPSGITSNASNGAENPRMQAAFEKLYSGHTELNGLYNEAISSRETLMNDLQNEMAASSNGAPRGDQFVVECTKLGSMISRDQNIQLVFMDVGGWDTHINQGNAKGQLANRLSQLGDGLAALTTGLGAQYQNTAILVMSEFGRTVAENGNAGTDHGHGNVAWLMGGDVKGGKVWGRWPGLSQGQLYQGRDVAVTTDFRSLIGAVLSQHFALENEQIGNVIPSYQPDSGLQGIIAV